jgi:dCTP deaminase
MAILIGEELRKALESGLIGVDPLDASQIGPGSIDLTLGDDFRIFTRGQGMYHIRDDSRFEDVTESVHVEEGGYIRIDPGEMILGITKERVSLSDSVSGRLEGRSRFARFGLAVHVTAGFMQPGIDNRQVLEIVNLGHTPLALYPGTRICQFVFEECKGSARYQGRFRGQEKP